MKSPSLIPYERRYREEVLSLMFYSRYTHTHFDWYKAGQWLDIDGPEVQMAFQDNTLIGVIGVSEPLNGAAWLRLVSVAQAYDPAFVLGMIWESLRVMLRTSMQQVALLGVHAWLPPYLPALGFQYIEDVVTLHRPAVPLPVLPEPTLDLRSGYIEDIPAICTIDHSAFMPPWQMSAWDIRMAQREAASCTIAQIDGQEVAYEISTRHHTSGHLARLAVLPDMQGQGIGATVLGTLLARYEKRGVRSMTVNTQQSNLHSQRLYERFGFRRNGFDLPVWICSLT